MKRVTLLLGAALTAALVLSFAAGQGVRAELVSVLEWQDATHGTYAERISDAGAVDKLALRYNSPGDGYRVVTLNRAVDTITIRSRAGASDSYVTQYLWVDGQLRKTWTIAAGSNAYANRSVAVPLAPGEHRINVVAGDNRTNDSLIVDRLVLDGPTPTEHRAHGSTVNGFPGTSQAAGTQAIRDHNALIGAETPEQREKYVLWFEEFGQYDIGQWKFDAARDAGAIPKVTLQPYFQSSRSPGAGWKDEADPLAAINSGKYDAWIDNLGRTLAAHNGRVLVRFAHEMNGTWFPWGYKSARETPAEHQAKYKAAFQRVVNRIKAADPDGTSKVEFVFAPNEGHQDLRNYYPGAAHVDWLGLDAYPGARYTGATTMTGAMLETYNRLKDLDLGDQKRYMVSETGACSGQGYDKPAYIRDGYSVQVPRDMDRIDAVTWFNIDKRPETSPYDECDFRLNSDADSLAAYRAVVDSPAWQGAMPAVP